MVMNNRNRGDDARRWWDDLPPGIRTRFATAPGVSRPSDLAPGDPADPPPQVRALDLFLDLSRLAALFAAVTAGIMLFLLVALSFVAH
jgi:hypothetical protein